MIRIRFTVDCHCGEEADTTTTFLNLDPDVQPFVIDLEMAASQESFYCDACGCSTYTGDLETICEDEDSCDGRDEDEE